MPMLACSVLAWAGLNALAWALGFGYEPPVAYRRLFVALNSGPLAKLTAFWKRRPYALMAAPLLVHPALAWWGGLAGLVWVACFLNTHRHAQEFPMDVAYMHHCDWRGSEFKT